MTNRRSWMLPVSLSLVTWTTLSLATPAPPQAGGPIGTNYCAANPNSTGLPGVVSAIGSTLVSANDVTLTASQLPPGQFGYFLVSRTQGFFDPGTTCNIFICLNSPIGRHNQPGLVGQGPSFSITLDLGAIPTPTGFVAVQPGETWNFQCWYRDWPYCTTLFTDAISITFQ